MALPKTGRLTGSEITEVVKKGRVFDSEFFRIKFFPVPAPKSRLTKLAVIVGSRVSRKSPERNKIKRRISEAVRLLIGEIRPGPIVILVKPPALGRKFNDLRSDLSGAFNKINQWGRQS